MKIVDVRCTGLAGGTVEGGWVDDLKPEDDVHTIVEVLTDEGLIGVGSVFTGRSLTEAAVRFLTRRRLLGQNVRFDVLAVSWPAEAREPVFLHIPHAFEPTGKFQMFS